MVNNMRRTFDEMDRLFDWMSGTMGDRMWGGLDMDLTDYDDELVVTVDIPGFEREEIDISMAGGVLTIAAEHTMERDGDMSGDAMADDAKADDTIESDGMSDDGMTVDSAGDDTMASGGLGRHLVHERQSESVSRRVTLPAAVIEEDASATYRNGVLTVTLPKETTAEDDSHHIDVE